MAIKAVLFDFMGTCLDWHSSVVTALPQMLPTSVRSKFALDWRQAYFDINADRAKNNQGPEDFDTTLYKALDMIFAREKYEGIRTDVDRGRLVQAFHSQRAWNDVLPALTVLKQKGYELFVHANGTTRLQLDLVRSAGLQGVFDMLFSSEMIGIIKPATEAYVRGLELIRRKPQECVMVAAHAYDTRGAKEVGMKTVYIYRWTDDILEDQDVVRKEHDVYLEDGMTRLVEAIETL